MRRIHWRKGWRAIRQRVSRVPFVMVEGLQLPAVRHPTLTNICPGMMLHIPRHLGLFFYAIELLYGALYRAPHELS